MNLLHIPLFIFTSLMTLQKHGFASPTPLNCYEPNRLCTSFIAFKLGPHQSMAEIQSMFDVSPEDVTVEDDGRDCLFIRKNCSCTSPIEKYLTYTTYTVKDEVGPTYKIVMDAYKGLAFLPNSWRQVGPGAVVSLYLLCGCSSGLWNYLMSYVIEHGDTVESLASRFGVSVDSIETMNGIKDPDNASAGHVYYIPLNTVPGKPHSINKGISPAPIPSPSVYTLSANGEHHSAHFPYGWALGSTGISFALILVGLIICIFWKSLFCHAQDSGSPAKDPVRNLSPKFYNLLRTSFSCGSGSYVCCKSGTWKQTPGDIGDEPNSNPKVTDIFDMENLVIFTYEEIFLSTDGFSDSNLLGNGSYGFTYYAVLRGQEVAIKRMIAKKTKEFMSNMKVLYKVHHANLVELIGYAASEDALFLIYEFAHMGSLRSHLHDPQKKGHTSLSWISRVQIALDAARGLEYIHEHTKAHYVHQDVKTSNILLDTTFRAKISDFGLAKFVGNASEGRASSARLVGNFGYLAPECLIDGLATTKSDVYAFGVVLFELISGKDAITQTEDKSSTISGRLLASIMLAALSSSSLASFKECIDPNLKDLYPHDCVYKVALLARQCLDEDLILRPDMKQVVISLSQILLSSMEWEATLAGNSQVFSGLAQGR